MNQSFVRAVKLDKQNTSDYPFSVPSVQHIESLDFGSPVTFFVGENGSGKSTLIEAIAVAAGFNAEGGTKNYSFSSQNSTSILSNHITLVRGAVREKSGYFLRAESFYTTANYAESGTFDMFGNPRALLFNNKHIHEQSHGEAFMAIINDSPEGLFIFDEPESALSPQRQLALLIAMKRLIDQGSQFIVATHSPILLAYPEASIYQLSQDGIDITAYDDVEHVKLTRDFLDQPNRYINRLLTD